MKVFAALAPSSPIPVLESQSPDAEKAEQDAENAEGAVNKAAAWREIAWAYYDMRSEDMKNLERCRRDLRNPCRTPRKFLRFGHVLSEGLAFASAANLYLELGETEMARQLVKKADGVNLSADMLGGIHSFTTTPLLISILVRVGDIDGQWPLPRHCKRFPMGKKNQGLQTPTLLG